MSTSPPVPDRSYQYSFLMMGGQSLGVAQPVTIESGAFTLTKGYHVVDTQSAAASDDLDTISGGVEGMYLVLRAANAARTVVVKHNTGNIFNPTAKDVSLAESTDLVALFYNGSKWIVLPPSLLAGIAATMAGSTAADGTGASGATAPAFTGTASTTATAEAFTGTGFATAGQVVTTSDNQTMTLNQCAGMWLITATQAPCLIASNTAVTGAPAVLTVYGLAPTTDAGTYKILKAPTPAGTVASHTHTGPSHTHGVGTITATV